MNLCQIFLLCSFFSPIFLCEGGVFCHPASTVGFFGRKSAFKGQRGYFQGAKVLSKPCFLTE